jgi:hypothetical protein
MNVCVDTHPLLKEQKNAAPFPIFLLLQQQQQQPLGTPAVVQTQQRPLELWRVHCAMDSTSGRKAIGCLMFQMIRGGDEPANKRNGGWWWCDFFVLGLTRLE